MPEPPERDQWEKQRETFADELVMLLEDPTYDLFFDDETGFKGDPRPRQRREEAGSQDHRRSNRASRNMIDPGSKSMAPDRLQRP